MLQDDYELFLIISSSSRKAFRGATKIVQLPPAGDALVDLLDIQKSVGCGKLSMKTNLPAREVIDIVAANGFYVYNTIYNVNRCDWFMLKEGQKMSPFCK